MKPSYITKDKSLILELINPVLSGNKNLSVAKAVICCGKKTLLHYHKNSEEVYYVLKGQGILTLGNRKILLKKGDFVLIPPLTPHNIENTGDKDLEILCICSPPYSHYETEIL